MKQLKASLILIAFSTLISNVSHSDSNNLKDHCQKFQTSDPLKRFLLELWDSDNGIDQGCAREREIKQLFNRLDIQHMKDEVADAGFRKRLNELDGTIDHESKTSLTSGSNIQIKTASSGAKNEEIPIPTVEGFQSIK